MPWDRPGSVCRGGFTNTGRLLQLTTLYLLLVQNQIFLHVTSYYYTIIIIQHSEMQKISILKKSNKILKCIIKPNLKI